MTLYDELGVHKDASQDEIKKAFREQAKNLHPDKPDGDEDKFKRIGNAYMVLMDPERRRRYDETGSESDEPTFEQKVRHIVLGIFDSVIASSFDEEHGDLVEQMAASLQKELEQCETLIKTAPDAITRMEKIKAKLRFSGTDEPDILTESLDAKLASIVKTTAELVELKPVIEAAIKVLDLYSYSFTAKNHDDFASSSLQEAILRMMGERGGGTGFKVIIS